MNSVAVKRIEWCVKTKCGRLLSWFAEDRASLMKALIRRGYEPTMIQTMTEYDAEIEATEKQEAYVFELNQAIEQEAKTA